MATLQREWDAGAYHRLAQPQFAWGLRVLERASLRGHERVLDAGCGSGRVTSEVVLRVPEGYVAAVDRSRAMIAQCRDTLAAAGERASCVRADLLALPFTSAFDVVFSAATFHWVLDHAALFAELARVLARGGRLEAQCGGGTNLQRTKQLAAAVARAPEFAGHFRSWSESWHYAGVPETARRLHEAGFVDVECWLEDAPVPFADAGTFRDFLRAVVLRPWLAHLPSPALQQSFVDAVTDAMSRTSGSFMLDYQRLNIRAART